MSLATILRPRICELGKIKIGGKGAEKKSQSGGTYRIPEKHAYFTITTLNRAPNGDLIPDAGLMDSLLDEYGEHDAQASRKVLKRIPIRVLSSELEDIMQTGYVWYNGKTVGARSDGEKVTFFVNPKSFKPLPTPEVRDWDADTMLAYTDAKGNRLFKLHSIFNCVIASAESRWGGVYKFRTTSTISAEQLYGSLVHLSQLTGGVLAGLPLCMVVRPIQVSPDGKPTTVYVVHVELIGADLLEIQNKALALAENEVKNRQKIQHLKVEYRRLLAPPGHEDDREAVDVAEEFSPESVEVVPVAAAAAPVGIKNKMLAAAAPAAAVVVTPVATDTRVEPVDTVTGEVYDQTVPGDAANGVIDPDGSFFDEGPSKNRVGLPDAGEL